MKNGSASQHDNLYHDYMSIPVTENALPSAPRSHSPIPNDPIYSFGSALPICSTSLPSSTLDLFNPEIPVCLQFFLYFSGVQGPSNDSCKAMLCGIV